MATRIATDTLRKTIGNITCPLRRCGDRKPRDDTWSVTDSVLHQIVV